MGMAMVPAPSRTTLGQPSSLDHKRNKFQRPEGLQGGGPDLESSSEIICVCVGIGEGGSFQSPSDGGVSHKSEKCSKAYNHILSKRLSLLSGI